MRTFRRACFTFVKTTGIKFNSTIAIPASADDVLRLILAHAQNFKPIRRARKRLFGGWRGDFCQRFVQRFIWLQFDPFRVKPAALFVGVEVTRL
jgi:hypothetical protein